MFGAINAAYQAAQEGDEHNEEDEEEEAQGERGKGGSWDMQQPELAIMVIRLGFCMYMVRKKDRSTLQAIVVVLKGLASLATENADVTYELKEKVIKAMDTELMQFKTETLEKTFLE